METPKYFTRLVDGIRDSLFKVMQPLEGWECPVDAPVATFQDAVKPFATIMQPPVPNLDFPVNLALDFAENFLKTKANLSLMMTRDEIAAIHFYSQDGPNEKDTAYFRLNELLREENRELLKPWFPFIKLMMIGMGKLFVQQAHERVTVERVVWRGINASLDQYKKGSVLTWWAFSSASLSESVVLNPDSKFLRKYGNRTLCVIKAKSGVEIAGMSMFEEETEFLLFPSTRFEVTDVIVSVHDPELVTMWMQELDCPTLRTTLTLPQVKETVRSNMCSFLSSSEYISRPGVLDEVLIQVLSYLTKAYTEKGQNESIRIQNVPLSGFSLSLFNRKGAFKFLASAGAGTGDADYFHGIRDLNSLESAKSPDRTSPAHSSITDTAESEIQKNSGEGFVASNTQSNTCLTMSESAAAFPGASIPTSSSGPTTASSEDHQVWDNTEKILGNAVKFSSAPIWPSNYLAQSPTSQDQSNLRSSMRPAVSILTSSSPLSKLSGNSEDNSDDSFEENPQHPAIEGASINPAQIKSHTGLFQPANPAAFILAGSRSSGSMTGNSYDDPSDGAASSVDLSQAMTNNVHKFASLKLAYLSAAAPVMSPSASVNNTDDHQREFVKKISGSLAPGSEFDAVRKAEALHANAAGTAIFDFNDIRLALKSLATSIFQRNGASSSGTQSETDKVGKKKETKFDEQGKPSSASLGTSNRFLTPHQWALAFPGIPYPKSVPDFEDQSKASPGTNSPYLIAWASTLPGAPCPLFATQSGKGTHESSLTPAFSQYSQNSISNADVRSAGISRADSVKSNDGNYMGDFFSWLNFRRSKIGVDNESGGVSLSGSGVVGSTGVVSGCSSSKPTPPVLLNPLPPPPQLPSQVLLTPPTLPLPLAPNLLGGAGIGVSGGNGPGGGMGGNWFGGVNGNSFGGGGKGFP